MVRLGTKIKGGVVLKRKISFVLALIMILSVIPVYSFAANNYDKELKEAITRSKKIFNIGDEYDKFEQDINTYSGDTVFYLNWSDTKNKLGGIQVAITTDGNVLSYSKWKPNYSEPETKLPKISQEEGLEIAKKFIKKVSPAFGDNIRYVFQREPLNIRSEGYSYYFVREENGIPYYENGIDIYVDNNTGEIRDYYTNWYLNLEFPSPEEIISMDKAQELYREKIGLELLYKTGGGGEKTKTYLAYGPLNDSYGIDAMDGNIVSFYSYYLPEMGGMGAKEARDESLSPAEEKAIKDIAGLIKEKEAEEIVRDLLGVDSQYKLERIGLYKSWQNNEYVYSMEFKKGEEGKEEYMSVEVNAKTKEIISFYTYGLAEEGKEIKYTEEEAQKNAEELINKLAPEKFKSVEFQRIPNATEEFKESKVYRFNYIRKINDAYVENEGIRVLVDGNTGKVFEYGLNWSSREFSAGEDLILVDNAYDILFKDIGMELRYISPRDIAYREDIRNKGKAQLAYALSVDKPANIDAKTGTILDFNGEPYKKPTKISYNDIENSYAKDKIKILAEYGIALPGEEFRPKNKMFQRDFLYLLAKANNSYLDYEIEDSDEKLYNYLINMGIVKENEKAPEKVVTKEEAVKYLIRAAGYSKIADLNDIYKDVFKDTKDIDPKLKGYVAIAHGLKIVEGSNGYLRPKAELNREDGANMIFNYLFN